MGIAGSAINLIRTVFARDLTLPYPATLGTDAQAVAGYQNSAIGPQSDYNNFMAGNVTIEQNLMARYADYEEMSQFPEIGAAFDLLADDATIQDVLTGRTIWFESPDKNIEKILNDMLTYNLRIEEDIRDIARGLVQYGNEFEEIIVMDGLGVIKLNNLNTPAVRRIEDKNGTLYGFVHDEQMAFSISTPDFMKKLRDKTSIDAMQVMGVSDGLSVYEPWEVVHFRLRGMSRKDLYGASAAEAARWVWKRLTMMEDAMVLYKLCLRGDSRVWTDSGTKLIRDLNEGDIVLSYGNDRNLKKTKVVYKKHNGKDKIFKVKSQHRTLYANATHPVLVHSTIHQGSGRPLVEVVEYVEVKDIVPGVHSFITPKIDDGGEYAVLKKPDVGSKAALRRDLHGKFTTDGKTADLQKIAGVSSPYARKFLLGESKLKLSAAQKVCGLYGINPDESLDVFEDWGGDYRVDLTHADEDFARWFGFMLGDGSLSETDIGDGNFSYRVSFAASNDEESNFKYMNLFARVSGKVNFYADRREERNYKSGNYSVSSKSFYEFMILNGYIPGCREKRVPEWVFRSPLSVRLAFLEGFCDADGCWDRTPASGSVERHPICKIEIANEEMCRQLRDLAMQCGLVVGNISTRVREARMIAGNDNVSGDTRVWAFIIVWKEQKHNDLIQMVELVDDDDIWDIGVEADEHNFVADGVVVHNTRSPQRLVFYVDVGDAPPNQAKALLQKIKMDFKKQKYVNDQGKLDLRYSPLSADEDLFIGTRKGKRSSEVEVLSGPEGQQIEDVNYFRDKLFTALKIPKSYLGMDETVGHHNLAQLDVRHARSVMRIQRELKNGTAQVGRVDLAARNIDPDKVDHVCKMVIPSGAMEAAQMEVMAAKMDLGGKYRDAKFSEYFIWSEILGLSDETINKIRKDRAAELGEDEANESVNPRVADSLTSEKKFFGVDTRAKDHTQKIRDEIAEGRSDFAKRMRELKCLMQEVQHSIKGFSRKRRD